MKYLYVLTSNEKDLYFEQALLSIFSLRSRMPDAFVSLLVDNATAGTFTGSRAQILGLINELKEIEFPAVMTNKERSRWLKTSMRRLISGDFLYIDCDTIIADDLSGISDLKIDLGAVLDIHLPLQNRFKNDEKKRIHLERDKKLGFTTATDKYFNGGVVLCKDTPVNYDFFDLWHRLWQSCVEKGISDDQPAFSQANISFNNYIQEIDGTWNCQIVRWGKQYLAKSKIIHYYNVEPNVKKSYVFANWYIYQDIKNTGMISESTMKLLKNPRAAFTPSTGIRFIHNKAILNSIDSLFFFIFKKLWK